MLATLQFGDNGAHFYSKEYLVSECICHFTRCHNHFRPDGNARCDKITLTVVAPGRSDLNLFEWYADGSVQSGRLLFEVPYRIGSGEEVRQIEFEDACCASLAEHYDIHSSSRRTITVEMVADKVTVDSVEFNKKGVK